MKFTNLLKQIDKKKLLLYSLSFFIYLVANNLLTSLINIPLRGKLKFNLCSSHHIPCNIDELNIYLISFFVLKAIFCFLLIFILLKRNNRSRSLLLLDFLFSYLMYDLALLVFWIFYYIGLFKINLLAVFISNPEAIFEHDFKYSSLLFASFWSLTLFTLLYKTGKLKFWFILKRVCFIPFSFLLFIIIERIVLLLF